LPDWLEGEVRGSFVWFNQATMFQTSELDYATVKLAKAAGVHTNCDVQKMLSEGIFTLQGF
jgi:hypothetical protein